MSKARNQRRLEKKKGWKPNVPDTAERLQATMRGLTKIFPGCHVTLLVAPPDLETGKHDTANYISTADRADMIAVMKEFIARQHEIPENLRAINDQPPTETAQ